MRQNRTLARIRQGKPAIGLWLQTGSFHTARLLAMQNMFDWLLVDMEHTPVDLSMASAIFAGIADISEGRCTPLARVPHGTLYHIKQALDAGAQGIVVPMVNTAEEAADAVRFARFPPMGVRGAGGLVPHLSFGTLDYNDYVKSANDEILVVVQIESVQSVENIEAILDVPGVDLIFIGPGDLHVSLGLEPTLWSEHPRFLAAVETVIQACQRRGCPYGTLMPNADAVKARLSQGFTLIGLGTDLSHMLSSLQAQYQQLQSSLS